MIASCNGFVQHHGAVRANGATCSGSLVTYCQFSDDGFPVPGIQLTAAPPAVAMKQERRVLLIHSFEVSLVGAITKEA